MFNKYKKHIEKIALLLVMPFFIYCESNFKQIQKNNITELNPMGEARNFNLKYTVSGKIKSVLLASQMLDYSQIEFPFIEFPKGVQVIIYDDQKNKSTVTAQYAVSYSNSNLIELKENVIITTHDGKKLETQQLYYDQKNQWFFTQKPYKFTDKGNIINGVGIDFSKDFKHLDTQQINGTYSI